MEQMVLYKGFRIRAYQDWSGQWLAETKRPIPLRPGVDHADTDAEYIATPSAHLTPEAAVNVIKQMIDSPSATIAGPKTIQYRTPDSRLLQAGQQIGQLGDIRCDPPRLIARPTSDGVLIAPAISQC